MVFTIIIFVIVLGILVFVHELGHFVMAKKMGMKVEEFGFGFPPKLWGRKGKDGVMYSINAIPMGGFVKIKGEDFDEKTLADPDSFSAKKPWQRFVVLIAGVTMNFLLCAILLSVGYLIGLPQSVESSVDKNLVRNYKIQVISLVKDSPAEKAGVELGDSIVKANGLAINNIDELLKVAADNVDKAVSFELKRDDQIITKDISPVILSESGKAGIGVGLVETGIIAYPWYLAIYKGFETTVMLAGAIIVAFYNVIKSLMLGHGAGMEVSGPVGIAVMTGQVAKLGFIYLLQFTSLLSLNLAIINFLPFPALDGGRLLFILVEKIRRKPINQKIESIIHTIGFSLLMLLVVVVTFGDIIRYSGPVVDWWRNLIK